MILVCLILIVPVNFCFGIPLISKDHLLIFTGTGFQVISILVQLNSVNTLVFLAFMYLNSQYLGNLQKRNLNHKQKADCPQLYIKNRILVKYNFSFLFLTKNDL